MDAFEHVSVPRYNVSLLGLRSLQNERYMYAVTVRRSTMQAITSMLKDEMFTMSNLLCGAGFLPGCEKWESKMCYRACSNEQFKRQHMKNKMIFFNKWQSTGCLDTHLAKGLV